MPFNTLGLPPVLCDTLRKQGFEKPTPIQDRAIPLALAGADLVASAETGSGKTAAFLLPILTRLLAGKRPAGTRALILVPTRELALQVRGVAIDLSGGTSIGCAAVYGGVGMDEQSRALRGGVDIVVATPGRLLDHAARGAPRFSGVQTLVLDEADRMLDMGFLPDVRRIFALLPAGRQTMLFSATMPPEVDRLSREVMRKPEKIRVGHPKKTMAPVGITHAIFPVPAHRKTALVTVLLRRERMDAVLVFTRTKHRADRLAKALRPHGIEAGVLHGDRTQGQREKTMAAFRAGTVRVLVATDLAARGIDVEGITHVVNFDFPRTTEDYLHRVGRTARAESKGDAFTLVAPEEMTLVKKLEKEIGASIPRVTLPEFDYAAGPPPAPPGAQGKGGSRGQGRGGRGGDDRPPPAPNKAEFWKRVRARQASRRRSRG